MVEYFSHDYGARNDPKLAKLSMDMGFEGVGMYWCFIEYMYEQGGYIYNDDLKSVAFKLQMDFEKIEKIVKNYKLFFQKYEKIFSKSILERLKARKNKCNKAKQAAKKRWKNEREINNANAMRTQCERNAIKGKESKVKYSKVKNIIKTEKKEKDYADAEQNSASAIIEKSLVLPKENPQHVQFVDRFGESYAKMTGMPYKSDKQHFKIAFDLIKKYGYEMVIAKTRILGLHCRDGTKWFTKAGWGDFNIGKLSKFWNELVEEKNEAQRKSEEWQKIFEEIEAEKNERVRQYTE